MLQIIRTIIAKAAKTIGDFLYLNKNEIFGAMWLRYLI